MIEDVILKKKDSLTNFEANVSNQQKLKLISNRKHPEQIYSLEVRSLALIYS